MDGKMQVLHRQKFVVQWERLQPTLYKPKLKTKPLSSTVAARIKHTASNVAARIKHTALTVAARIKHTASTVVARHSTYSMSIDCSCQN